MNHGYKQDFSVGNSFKKLSKNFLKKIAKIHYFSIGFSQLNNTGVNFCAYGRKVNLQKMLEKAFLNFENILSKIRKNELL